MPQKFQKILLIRYSSMGDVLLLAPLLAVLKQHYGSAEVSLITAKQYADLFLDDSRLSHVVGVAKGERCTDTALLNTHWDILLDLQNNSQSRREIEKLTFKTLRRFNKLHGKRALLFLLRISMYQANDRVVQRYIRTLEEGQTTAAKALQYRIPFDVSRSASLQSLLQPGKIKRPVLALFPFSAWKNKQWLAEHFISVGSFFLVKGWSVVLFGGPEDQRQADSMKNQIGMHCISLAGKISLYECGVLLGSCHLALGNDSGLAHLARASGVKTGIIYGPTARQLGFFPEGLPRFKIFEKKLLCRPCHPHGGNVCLRLTHRCMRAITAEQVIKGMVNLHDTQEPGGTALV